MSKRESYISWDEYFMGVALLAGLRSKDPNTQVGACIVSEENRILSTGYNGLPFGMSDDDFAWSRDGAWIDSKYPYVCHAELNAILNHRGPSLRGGRIYVALFPCNECAKAIVQAGISEVIYLSDKYREQDVFRASRRILEAAGIKLRQLHPKQQGLWLDFTAPEMRKPTATKEEAGAELSGADAAACTCGQKEPSQPKSSAACACSYHQ